MSRSRSRSPSNKQFKKLELEPDYTKGKERITRPKSRKTVCKKLHYRSSSSSSIDNLSRTRTRQTPLFKSRTHHRSSSSSSREIKSRKRKNHKKYDHQEYSDRLWSIRSKIYPKEIESSEDSVSRSRSREHQIKSRMNHYYDNQEKTSNYHTERNSSTDYLKAKNKSRYVKTRSPCNRQQSHISSRNYYTDNTSKKNHHHYDEDQEQQSRRNRSPDKHHQYYEDTYRESRKYRSPENLKHTHIRSRDQFGSKEQSNLSPSRNERGKQERRYTRERPRFYYSESCSEKEEEEFVRYKSVKHGDPNKVPKHLMFNGSGNWLSFKQKFESYRKVYNWSESECRDYLNWTLDGKALDYFTITTQMGEYFSFREIMHKLEERFGAKELLETSKAKFQQASQHPKEDLEDWADRVLTLATPAFRKLPEQHRSEEAISKFCQNCRDKDAGKHACFEQPKSMQEAINKIRHFQYITQAIEGKKTIRAVEEINAVDTSPSKSRMEKMEKELELMKTELTKTRAELASYKGDGEKKNKFGRKFASDQCFFCNKFGHHKKDCIKYQNWLEKKKKENNPNSNQSLNKQGPGE